MKINSLIHTLLEAEARPVTKEELDKLEEVLDALFAKVGIDVEFTAHFFDRVNDARNNRQITIQELRMLFSKTYQRYGKDLSDMKNLEAVINDMMSKINVPFLIRWNPKHKMLELVAKTVMRKDKFATPNKVLKV